MSGPSHLHVAGSMSSGRMEKGKLTRNTPCQPHGSQEAEAVQVHFPTGLMTQARVSGFLGSEKKEVWTHEWKGCWKLRTTLLLRLWEEAMGAEATEKPGPHSAGGPLVRP